MNSSPKAIIVGAGIAGIAAAIRLAVQGMDVHVFEKNAYPGGKLSDLEMDGYRFDAGPSLFTQPANIEELFALAGEPIGDYFTYTKMPVSCKYFFADGTEVNAYADKEHLANELSEKLGETKESVRNYLERSEKIYTAIGTVFINHSLHKRKTLFSGKIWKALKAARWPYLFNSLHQLNSTHFANNKTVQLFNRYATYNGSDPYKAPGMLSLIPHLEHNEGVFYPKGGMISITQALYRLALKKGVQFYFNSPVQRIIHHERKIKGVVVNDENIPADIVVSNMDTVFTYRHLMHDERKAAKILKQERSSSAMIFYWGIKKEFPALGLHNIFFSTDYKAEFDHLFRLKKIYTDPTVYINITSKCEPGVQAPAGKENWFVMVNAPANVGQDWESYKTQYRKIIIDKLNTHLQADIESLIETEAILDPVLIESKTSSFMGSLYGTSSNSKMAAFLRHPNFSRSINGLYFVGGSVHPGGGIPLCLKSAKITGDLIHNNQKRKH
jgi:phytoene desaturase